MFSKTEKRLYEILGENRTDTIITRIKRKVQEIEDGLGPKLFGSITKYGFDSWCMGVVLCVQFILLLYITINHEDENNIIFWILFAISIITTIIPLLFVYGGKCQLNIYCKVIKNMIGDVNDINKQYQINISDLQERVDK